LNEKDAAVLVPNVTNRLGSAKRQLVCAACGTEFGCDPDGACWCMEESVRLPLPTLQQAGTDQDCLCRNCLHRLAKQQHVASR
jgi:Cysteine-rich CWC